MDLRDEATRQTEMRHLLRFLTAVYLLLLTVGLYRLSDRVDALEVKIKTPPVEFEIIPSAPPVARTPDGLGPPVKIMPRQPRVEPENWRQLDLRPELRTL